MTEKQSDPYRGPEDRDWSKPILFTTTVAKLGPKLPLGIKGAEPAPLRGLGVRSWSLKEERVLGHRRDEDEDRNMGKYVSIVLATMCTQLGGNSWPELLEGNTADRELVVSQMWMPDVFYAYVWLRMDAMSEDLPMGLKCPNCGVKFDWVGDLRTLEVKVPKTLEDAMWHYNLRKPLALRDKEVHKLVLGPPRWYHIEGMGDTSMGAAKGKVIHAHIHQMPELQEGEIVLDETELDGLSKRDLEGIAAAIEDNGFGPNMKVDAKCPKGHTFEAPLDWRYDQFFGISSPSPA